MLEQVRLDGGHGLGMAVQTTYQFLEPRSGSNYRQWFLKGHKIRAEILSRATVGPEPRTPEEIAHDFGVPIEAVRDAVHYCLHKVIHLAAEHYHYGWSAEELMRQHADLRPEEVYAALTYFFLGGRQAKSALK